MDNARWVYDDRAPDEDAHTWYGVTRSKGAVVVVRPDLWVGTSAFLDEADELGTYFDQFLLPVVGKKSPSQSKSANGDAIVYLDGTSNGHAKSNSHVNYNGVAGRTPMAKNDLLRRDNPPLKGNPPYQGELSNGLTTLKVNISIEDPLPKTGIPNMHAPSDGGMANWDSPSLKNLMGI